MRSPVVRNRHFALRSFSHCPPELLTEEHREAVAKVADDLVPAGSPLTLRELIERVVRAEVAGFAERQAERRLIHFLSEQQIGELAARGRVDFGGRELDQQADVEDSVGVALESFEDGVYLVLIDGHQYESLDATTTSR
jgi:hypothetical protein